jgi:hypothetical protein
VVHKGGKHSGSHSGEIKRTGCGCNSVPLPNEYTHKHLQRMRHVFYTLFASFLGSALNEFTSGTIDSACPHI